MKRAATLCLLLILAATATAGSLRPFDAGSLASIRAAHDGRAFLLVLWSVHCAPCRDELVRVRDAVARRADVAAVFVATDPPAEHADAERLWTTLGMAGSEGWAFADDYLERLRWAIDPNWMGELPRAYLYRADHRREGRSGRLEAADLSTWLDSLANH